MTDKSNTTPREGYDQKKYDEGWDRVFGPKKTKEPKETKDD